jgi:regulator of sirC expression with transglutaminase-like and TPR domain
VGFPGHFLVKTSSEEKEIFLDPFDGGRIVSIDDLASRLSAGGAAGRLTQHLAAVTKRQILTRMLTNLKFTYLELQQFERAHDIVNLLLAIAPWDLDQVKDRGLIGYRLGRYRGAYEDLRAYVEYRPDAQDAEWVLKMARTVEALAEGPTG